MLALEALLRTTIIEGGQEHLQIHLTELRLKRICSIWRGDTVSQTSSFVHSDHTCEAHLIDLVQQLGLRRGTVRLTLHDGGLVKITVRAVVAVDCQPQASSTELADADVVLHIRGIKQFVRVRLEDSIRERVQRYGSMFVRVQHEWPTFWGWLVLHRVRRRKSA